MKLDTNKKTKTHMKKFRYGGANGTISDSSRVIHKD